MKQLKRILLTAIPLVCSMLMYAQARDASVTIDKENRHAVMIAIDQPVKITSDALLQRLERAGLKEKAKKGIIQYKGVTFSEIGPDKVDIYTKVEPGANNSSIVYMAVSRGYDNFTNSTADSTITENVKTFLQSFVKDANDHSANIKIGNQLTDISKDEKDYQALLDEQKNLQKKKLAIDNRLLEIQNELSLKRDNIDKKKSGVEDAKVKRSTAKDQ